MATSQGGVAILSYSSAKEACAACVKLIVANCETKAVS